MACEMKSASCGLIAVLAIILFSAAFISFASESDADGSLQIRIDTVSVTSGDRSIEVPIIIESNSGFFGGEFEIGYDRNLTLTGISPGIVSLTPNDDFNMNPYPFYVENTTASDVTQTGLLATLIFDVSKGISGEFPIILDFSEVFNTSGEEVDVICEDGAIIVSTVRIPVTGVSVTPSVVSINVGQSETISAFVSPSNATNKNVSWKSTNASVVAVSSTGIVTGIKAGSAAVTVTTQDGSFSAVCTVNVGEGIPVTSITLNADSLSLEIGDTYALKATVLPTTATDKRVTWTSSQGDIVSVDSSGKVTAKSEGSAYIMATAVGGDIVPAICFVQVEKKTVSVTGVTLNKTALSLKVGEKSSLTATVSPSDATDKKVTWKSSNTSVATVSNGAVTAVSAGTATITVTTSDGGYKATCKVTVTKRVSSVSLSVDTVQSEPGAKNVEVGIVIESNSGFWGSDFEIAYDDSLTLKELKAGSLFTITPNENYGLNPYFFYAESSNTSDVSSTGVLATLVFDVAGDASGSLPVSISDTDMYEADTTPIKPSLVPGAVVIGSSDIKVTGVDVTPDKLTLEVGKTGTLSANVSPSDATNKAVTWKSSNASVATVSSTGVVTAIKAGTANIYATTVDGNFSDICSVTVSNPVVPVSGVTLNTSKLTLETGDKSALKATVAPSNATDKSVSWKSSKTAVAKVSSTGVVTAVGPGTATITVTTNDGAKTAVCVVTVKAPIVSVTGVELDVSALSIEKGSSAVLNATVSPSDATDKSVTWKSSRTAVATVSNGVVKGVATGSATITVTTVDGSYTATCTVKVVKPSSEISEGDIFVFGGIEYTVLKDEKSVSATGCTSEVTAISLPATVAFKGADLAVVSIGEKAFYGNGALVSVDTGKALSIGLKAVANCPSLSDVITDAESISSYAFYGCPAIAHAKFSDRLSAVGTQAFGSLKFTDFKGNELQKNAAGLAGKEFSGSNSVLVASPEAGDSFSADGLIYTIVSGGSVSLIGCAGNIAKLEVPSEVAFREHSYAVDSIGAKAFFENESLASVSMGSIVSIGSKAFANCPALSSVSVDAQSISGYAFYGCPAIAYMSFSDRLSEVGAQAFGSLKFTDSDGTVLKKTAENLAGKEFCGSDGSLCRIAVSVGEKFYVDGLRYTVLSLSPSEVSLSGYQGKPTVVIAPESVEYGGLEFKVTRIAGKAFYGCESIVFADISVASSTGTRVFSYCTNLASAVLNLERIENYTFLNCPSLRYVDVSGVKEIATRAFQGCTSLAAVSFSEDLSFIESKAFNGISLYGADGSLLSTNVDSLRGKSFAGGDAVLYERLSPGDSFVLDGIKYSITDGSSVAVTGYEGTVSALYIPASVICGGSAYSVDSVAARAFYGCETLEYLDLGSVFSVGERAFANCKALAGMKSSASDLGAYCFFGCPLRNVDLTSAVSIEASAFSECKAFESLKFSDSLAYVGKNAFYRAFFYGPDGKVITEDAQGLAGKTFMGKASRLYLCPEVGSEISAGGLVYTVYSVMPNEASVIGYEEGTTAISVPMDVQYGGLSFQVRSIGDQAFYQCKTLVYAYLGSVESVGFKAFAGCTELVYVDTSAEYIGGYAFFGCSKLYGIDLSSAEFVGASAFSGVPLAAAVFSGDLDSVGKNAFYGLTFMENGSALSPTAGNLAGKSFAGSGKVLVRVA